VNREPAEQRLRKRTAYAVLAVAAPAAAAADGTSGPVLGVMQLVMGLALVLGLIVLASWLLRRFGAGPSSKGSLIRVVHAASVGPRERVVLVEIQDTWLVLGVTSGQINALHRLPRQEIAQLHQHAPQPPGGFAKWLADARRRQDPSGPDVSA
jgi:flagellar protein FliO/FliZ